MVGVGGTEGFRQDSGAGAQGVGWLLNGHCISLMWALCYSSRLHGMRLKALSVQETQCDNVGWYTASRGPLHPFSHFGACLFFSEREGLVCMCRPRSQAQNPQAHFSEIVGVCLLTLVERQLRKPAVS